MKKIRYIACIILALCVFVVIVYSTGDDAGAYELLVLVAASVMITLKLWEMDGFPVDIDGTDCKVGKKEETHIFLGNWEGTDIYVTTNQGKELKALMQYLQGVSQ